MAKRKQRASARKKAASKRGKVRTKAKSASRKAAKRVAVKTKAKKQATKARAKRAAPETAAPLPTEPSRQAAGASDDTVIVDIIEEPVPGVVVVTEFESVRTGRPETAISPPDEP